MNKTLALTTGMLVLFLLVFSTQHCHADTIATTESFTLNLAGGESLAYQSLSPEYTITFAVVNGTLNATSTMTTSDSTGSLAITSTSAGYLNVTSSTAAILIYVNGLGYFPTLNFLSGITYTITWYLTGTPPPTAPPVLPFGPGIDPTALWVFLWNWDFVGFILACYISTVGEWFFVLLGTIIGGVLYIRTKNIAVLGVAWIITGAVFIPVYVIAAPVIIIMMILGISAVLYKLFQHPT